jgi:endolysin
VDGEWGDASWEAHDATVEAVQAAVGAVVDGVYGPATNSAVSIALAGAEKP